MVHTNFIGKRTTKRVAVGASVVLMLVMVGVAMTGTAAADAPDCSTVSYSGDGTTSSPYEVGNVDQLQCIESQGLDASYEITSDIDASGTSSWNFGSGFDPIGDDSNPFTGGLTGNGNTITGLTINRGSQNEVGLFGQIGSDGGVQGVILEDVESSGLARVGALAGDNAGNIARSSASGSVTGSDYNVGGLVGFNSGTITISSSTATVASSGNVGGFIGNNAGGSITNSYARGDVTATTADFRGPGGFVGTGSGSISRSYSTGDVNGGRGDGRGKGGFAGGSGAVSESYWDVPASGLSFSSGGGTGLGDSSDTPPADEMTGDDAPSNMAGFDFTDTWQTVPGDYPILAWQTEDGNGGDPPEADLVSINSPDSAQPDGDFDFTVEMEESSVGEVAVESSDFDVSLSVVDDSGDDIGSQTDTSVEFIDLDEETSTYTLNVDVTGGSEGDTGTITAATGGSIDGSGVDDQTSTTFSLADAISSPVDGVSDELWTAVTQDDGNSGLSLADLGNAIQQYQKNPSDADVDGVSIDLSDLGSLIQHYRTEVV